VPAGKLEENNMEKIFLASLKSLMKKEVRSGVGSGSGSAPKCHGSPKLLLKIKRLRELMIYTKQVKKKLCTKMSNPGP
jgi:hypothetical protein